MFALRPTARQTPYRIPYTSPDGVSWLTSTSRPAPSIRRSSRPTLDHMATTLQDPRVATVLDGMYTESKNQMSLLRERRGEFDRPMTTAERSEAMSEFYIPVTPEAGRLLYSLVRATRPKTIVEFGMS